ncbi:MAG: hypothetical protein E5W45_04515, partial [Mesorhizobium sp.]
MRHVHLAQALDVGEQTADARSGRGAGCLIGIADQDDAIFNAILGDGDVGQPALDLVHDLEIAECLDEPRQGVDQRFPGPLAQGLYPGVTMIP